MKNKVLKENDNIKVIRYNGLDNRHFYIMYLYNEKEYFNYKGYLLQNRFIINKIYKLKGCIKFCYKRGYNPAHRIQYYDNFNLVGIMKAVKLGLVK